MPAGDLITANWQVEIRGLLTGAETSYGIGPIPKGINGLANPGVKTQDVDLHHAAGSYAGRDDNKSRTIIVDYWIRGTTEADAFVKLKTLTAAWDPSQSTDIPLYIRLPGVGKFYVNGRPRGLLENTALSEDRRIEAVATFFCPIPTITYVP